MKTGFKWNHFGKIHTVIAEYIYDNLYHPYLPPGKLGRRCKQKERKRKITDSLWQLYNRQPVAMLLQTASGNPTADSIWQSYCR